MDHLVTPLFAGALVLLPLTLLTYLAVGLQLEARVTRVRSLLALATLFVAPQAWATVVIDANGTILDSASRMATIKDHVLIGGRAGRTSYVTIKNKIIEGTVVIDNAYQALLEDVVIVLPPGHPGPAVTMKGLSLWVTLNRVQIISPEAHTGIAIVDANGVRILQTHLNGPMHCGICVTNTDSMWVTNTIIEEAEIGLGFMPTRNAVASNIWLTNVVVDRITSTGLLAAPQPGSKGVHNIQMLGSWFAGAPGQGAKVTGVMLDGTYALIGRFINTGTIFTDLKQQILKRGNVFRER